MQKWITGARPRTLPAAVVPVGIGAGCAHVAGSVAWWPVVGALVVSLALQVGVNYANDYSDGVRGTDDDRVGPARLVGSGLAEPAAVRRAALLAFAVAGVAGLAVAAVTSWWLVPVGVASVAAAWGYTGGPRPYGYLGLGELFVFVFFGLVATMGTTYVAHGSITPLSAVLGSAAGAVACALLVINNLRDIPSDTVAGKRTLAVRLGDAGTRNLYRVLMALVFALVVVAANAHPPVLLGLVAGLGVVRPLRAVAAGTRGIGLVAALNDTARLQLVFGFAVTAGLFIGQ